jgi:hypothetical protein
MAACQGSTVASRVSIGHPISTYKLYKASLLYCKCDRGGVARPIVL